MPISEPDLHVHYLYRKNENKYLPAYQPLYEPISGIRSISFVGLTSVPIDRPEAWTVHNDRDESSPEVLKKIGKALLWKSRTVQTIITSSGWFMNAWIEEATRSAEVRSVLNITS